MLEILIPLGSSSNMTSEFTSEMGALSTSMSTEFLRRKLKAIF
jgi:hypothetical protein